MKLNHGEVRETPGRAGRTYLHSEEAEQAWEDFEQWLLDANREDNNFEIRSLRDGKPVATALIYLKRDALLNFRYGIWGDEASFLRERGFGE